MLLSRMSRFEFAIILILMIVHLVVAVSPVETLLRWYPTDDAFYYFKVAQNIGEGHGITFDGLGTTNGFHPLWMLICIPVFLLARLNRFLPLRVLVMILGILQASTGILLYRLARKSLARPMAMGVAILWVFSPFVYTITAQNGLESGISAFFLALTLYQISEIKPLERPASTRQLVLVGLFASLAFLSRLDNIFVLVLLGIWLVFLSSPIRYYLSLDILALAVSVFLSFMLWVGLNLVFYQYGRSALVMVALAIIFKVTASYFSGLYQPPHSVSILSRLKSALIGITIGSAVTAALMFGLMKVGLINGFPRMALLIDWGLSIVLLMGIRLLIDWLVPGKPAKTTPVKPLVNLKDNGTIWFRRGGYYFGILGTVMVAYLAWNAIQFGTLTPVSGQIKEWWGTIYTIYGRPAEAPTTFFGIDTRFISASPTDNSPVNVQSRTGPWVKALSWLMLPARFIPARLEGILWLVYGILGLAILKSRRTHSLQAIDQIGLLPLLAGCLLQVWVLNASGYVAIRTWYWVAESLVTCLAAGVILNSVLTWFSQPQRRAWIAYAGLGILSLLVFYDYALMLDQRIFFVVADQNDPSYLVHVTELESSTEPGAVIGMTGGGDMAYLIQDRTIVNLDGLISSYPYFQALKNSRAADYLASIHLKYVFGRGSVFTQMDPYQIVFAGKLTNIAHFTDLGLFLYNDASEAK